MAPLGSFGAGRIAQIKSKVKKRNEGINKRVKDLNRKELENLYQAIKRQEAFNKAGKTYRNGNQI